ncbi:MAG TPA: helix-turn-helix transcriptional regulator [Methylomirabilota bacterium]|nr:helix-turn-helix transcriptional regulator [Methylomirabilota bacterium]
MLQRRTITKQNLKIAKHLKRYRKAKGMTQETLAEKVGVSLGWISRVERGVNAPNLTLLTKIARTLDVKVKDLIPF